MDIKGKINEVVDKIKSDPKMLERFGKEPVKVVEELIGVDLPDDQINPVIETIKAKITMDKIGGALGGLFGKK